MATIATTKVSESIDEMLSKYEHFSRFILPTMKEGIDYHVINSKKSLSKAGSERLCALYKLTATFSRDSETLESFKSTSGLVCYICTLKRPDGSVAAEGRGAYLSSKCNGDVNKCVKMATKSAVIDATLRAVGISSFFSQDLETMSAADVKIPSESNIDESASEEDDWAGIPDCDNSGLRTQRADIQANMITPKQKTFLTNLAYEHMTNERDREEFLASLDGMNKEDASDSIGSFISK